MLQLLVLQLQLVVLLLEGLLLLLQLHLLLLVLLLLQRLLLVLLLLQRLLLELLLLQRLLVLLRLKGRLRRLLLWLRVSRICAQGSTSSMSTRAPRSTCTSTGQGKARTLTLRRISLRASLLRRRLRWLVALPLLRLHGRRLAVRRRAAQSGVARSHHGKQREILPLSQVDVFYLWFLVPGLHDSIGTVENSLVRSSRTTRFVRVP